MLFIISKDYVKIHLQIIISCSGSILTVGTSLSAFIGNEYISEPTPTISITITISYFLGTREINVTSISIDDPFGRISVYGTIVNSF